MKKNCKLVPSEQKDYRYSLAIDWAGGKGLLEVRVV